jgi:hypothetical protein
VTSAIADSEGAVVSTTRTWKEERAVPAAFRAVILTIVVPSGNRVPLRFE